VGYHEGWLGVYVVNRGGGAPPGLHVKKLPASARESRRRRQPTAVRAAKKKFGALPSQSAEIVRSRRCRNLFGAPNNSQDVVIASQVKVLHRRFVGNATAVVS